MIKHSWPSISKFVGWDTLELPAPSMDEVDEVCNEALIGNYNAIVQLLRWYRFLRSPASEEDRKVHDRIIDVLFESRDKYCE